MPAEAKNRKPVDGKLRPQGRLPATFEPGRAAVQEEGRDFAEAVVRTARDPLLILNGQLEVEIANDAFYSTFKVNRAESIGRSVFDLDHHHWDIPKLRELLEDILPRHSFFNDFEVTHDFEHIGQRTMLLNARTLKDEAGAAKRILLGIQDVTELLHFQVQMRRSELRYRRLFEAARDGVLLVDPITRKIVDANPFMSELLGYSHDELVGKELFEIGLLKDEAANQAAFEELQKNGFIRYEDLPLATQNNQRREVEFVSNLYREGDAKIIQCNIRDVTARKKGESDLRESERRYRSLFNSIDEGFCVIEMIFDDRGVAADYRFIETNPSFEKHTGFIGLGKRMREIEPEHEDFWFETYGNVVRTREPTRFVYEAEKLNRWFDVFAFPADSGEERQVAILFRDITEHMKAQIALQENHLKLVNHAGELEQAVAARTVEMTAAYQQLEDFVYAIAHDLRAPLRAMEGYSVALVEEASTSLSKTCQEFAFRIGVSARFMDALLKDLIAFSGISQQAVDLSPVNLERVVCMAVSCFQNQIVEQKARIAMEGPWPYVLAHEVMLGMAVSHLVDNALKFVTRGVAPIIRVWAEEKGEIVRLWVEDNGIGIEPARYDEAFRMFARLNGDTYAGTGIGLAIVKKAISRMSGQCGVLSTPGIGSRFWVELPKAPAQK